MTSHSLPATDVPGCVAPASPRCFARFSKCLLLGWMLIFLLIPAPHVRLHAAQPVLIRPDLKRLALGTYIDILEDKTGRWTITDVVSGEVAALFVPSTVPAPGFGFTSSAYWVRFTVVNAFEEPMPWFLEVAYPSMDRIDMYLPSPSGEFLVKQAGDMYPFRMREVQHRNFIFSMLEPSYSQLTYYMRFQTLGAINIPLEMLSYAGLAEKSNTEQILLGIYHGAILVMLIYNFFIFLSIRDMSYLYYVLFNSGWVLAMLTLNGVAFQYLWPQLPWWANHSLLFFFCFSFTWGVQFTRTFLHTPQKTPRCDKVLWGLLAAGFLGMTAALFTSYTFSVRLTNVIGMLSLLGWLIGFLCLLQGSRPARYYVLAWTALILGIAVLSLKNFGILPHNTFTIWAPQIGSATEITLLSLGLADRIKMLQREKEHIQGELLSTRLTMQEALLKEVHHRVKNNLQVIASLLHLQSGYSTDTHVLEMFKESQQRVESMGLIHDKLAQSEHLTKVDFAEYIHTLCIHLFASYGVRLDAIQLKIDVEAVTLGVDTAVPCGLILNELVTNALKHAFPDGQRGELRVHLYARETGRLLLQVSDNGIGFPTDVDFRHTPSLGLQLVCTLTEQLDGTIELESHQGTTVKIAFTELEYKQRD
jgi:two-component system, sensor histidine kinase LadS